MKKDEIGGTRSTHGRGEKMHTVFGCQIWNEETTWKTQA